MALAFFFIILFLSVKVDGFSSNRLKRGVDYYSPFNLQQIFQRNPSPLDNYANRNDVGALIKHGLNAINELGLPKLSSAQQSFSNNETDKTRNTVRYNSSPFNLQQFFQRNPSPLDNANRNGVDALIKRGLNAINDLSKLSLAQAFSNNETDKNRNTNTNTNVDIAPGSITDSLKSQIEAIQLRLNSLAVEMNKFIQIITKSTSQLFSPFPTQNRAIRNNNQLSLFSWLP